MSVVGWPIGSSSPDVLGSMATNNEGKNVGYELIDTDLEGTWHGNSNSLLINVPETPGDKCSGRKIIEAGNGQMWFFMQKDGVFKAYVDGSRDAAKLIRGATFEGRLFHVTPFHYTMVLGAHQSDKAGWFGSYYPAMLNMNRDFATIFLLGSAGGLGPACRDYGVLFKEQQWFSKISNEVDLDLMRSARQISDQWLWQAAPEENAAGEQYPSDCPDPDPTYPVEDINNCWGGNTEDLPE